MEYVLLVLLAVLVIGALISSIRLVRQQQVFLVERLGKYHGPPLDPGLHLIVPFVDKVRYKLDMREAVVPFPPQGVITEDNLMVSIDSVIYYQIMDPERAAYEAQNYIQAIEQLTQTTLRNIIGGLDLEQTLTSREEINAQLRAVLDDATGKWGIKVNRVELRSIEPPATIRDAMEKGARAERDKRAQILLAEGQRQSQILSAGGDRESAILRAQGEREAAVLRAQADRQSSMLRAEGEAQAISTVFNAIHAGKPDQALLSYQYLQMMPQLAKGDSNKMWIIPSEVTQALQGIGGQLKEGLSGVPQKTEGEFQAPEKIDVFKEIQEQSKADEAKTRATVDQAIAEAKQIENAGTSPKPKKKSSLSRGVLDAKGPAGIGTGGPETPAPEQSAPAPQSQPQFDPGQAPYDPGQPYGQGQPPQR
ncbi:SPFH domain-containing protein [Parenemella sanctibonifatiensis]|uniref:Paraslipin n=1 Tax=Parenemella sanctibonifatiensis TaxID=2016505 RepID=A0A255EM67_9ACTN|nr:SPFH domain-containing protein [Parenemella sanctibonifatiensis]OYN92627.1 paraslipin [Parenemella sanctibonifatiensis]